MHGYLTSESCWVESFITLTTDPSFLPLFCWISSVSLLCPQTSCPWGYQLVCRVPEVIPATSNTGFFWYLFFKTRSPFSKAASRHTSVLFGQNWIIQVTNPIYVLENGIINTVIIWVNANEPHLKKNGEVIQLCLILYDPMDCVPGSSIHRIFQARVLEWVAIWTS